MKNPGHLIFLFLITVIVYFPAWSADISGTVIDALTGIPLPNTNIIIQGTDRGAATDTEGHFVIRNLPAGEYTLKARFIGYEIESRTIRLKEDETVQLNFKLREGFFQTQQVVVTATRQEKLMQDVPVVTEFISKAEIDERGAENMAQALEDRPGIIIQENASGGKSLNLNGIDGRRILILVDGLPIAGRLNNQVDLTLLDTDRIDHIEIVKGPGSALYGSEAMGGVVNIITGRIPGYFNVKAKAKYGTHDLYSGNVKLSGQNYGLGYLLNIDHSQGGVDKNEAAIDITDLWSNSVNGKISFKAPIAGDITAGAEFKRDGQDYQGTGMGGSVYDYEAQVERVNSFLGMNRTGEKVKVKIQGYVSDYFRTLSRTTVNSNTPATIDTTGETILGLKSDFILNLASKVKLDIGYDYANDSYESGRLQDKSAERNQHGVFAQAEINPVTNLTLNLGGRYDKITELDGYVSPRISGMYNLSQDFKVRASWGGGFRAPSFTDMYIEYGNPFMGMVVGNPELKPETSTGANAGIEYFWNSKMLVNVTYFDNRFKDLIVDYDVAPKLLSYRNIEKATFRGAELQSRYYILDNLTATLAYNYTSIDQSDKEYTVSRISPHTASLRVVYKLFRNRLSITARDQFYGRRDVKVYDPAIGQYLDQLQKKDAYNLLDLSFSYKLNRILAVRCGMTNLMDYRDEIYGPWIGRRLFVTLDTDF
ncbi:TonB-dependent receptor [candidate division KSB1 bacterium]|nr:TonB-dependent receptor [candidate division KSB1 bacterium]